MITKILRWLLNMFSPNPHDCEHDENMCDYVTFYGKRNLAEVVKLLHLSYLNAVNLHGFQLLT